MQLLHVYRNILDSVAPEKEVDIIYLDLSKAFDKVPHNLLLLKLNSYGISGSLLSWFSSYLTERYQRVVFDGVYSDWLPITSGVPQGSVLGPLPFLIYVNDLLSYTNSQSTIALFADDSKLYRPIDLPDSTYYLQNDLDNLHKWSLDWAMKFNESKCQVLRALRKKVKTVAQYNLDGQLLECVLYVKDLGVTVCSDVSWTRHIEETLAKANRTLGLVKQICKDMHDQVVRKVLFCTLVRLILEYASNLWSPYTIKHNRLFENVQRRATKFILENSIKILPLEFRRKISDLCLLFKSRTGAITMDVNNHMYTFEPGHQTRNYDKNNYNLIIKHKQDYSRNSFFIRLVELWNTLPSHVKSCSSLGIFKSHFHKLYSSKLSHYIPPGST